MATQRSPFLIIMLFVSVIGMIWLSLNDIQAGQRYTTLFFASIAFLMLMYLFMDEESKKSIQGQIGMPFHGKLSHSIIVYVIGLLIPILLFLLLNINTSAVAIPLAVDQINLEITNAFSALEIQNSPEWTFLITVWVAGTLEELLFAFVMVLAGAMILSIILAAFGVTANRFVLLMGGSVLSVLTFVFIHQLNATYVVASMFVFAAVFRAVLNFMVYQFGLMLSFAVGVHQSNNLVYYYTTFGHEQFMTAITGFNGLFIIYFVFVFAAALLSIGQVRTVIANSFKRFRTLGG